MQPKKTLNEVRFLESLEARLRALPPFPVPGDLEARLMAAIPAEMPSLIPRQPGTSHRHWFAWAGVAVASAAACVLLGLLRPETGRIKSVPSLVANPEKSQSMHPVTLQRPGNVPRITPWLEARRGLEGPESLTFTWPIQEKSPLMVSTSIPPDLLN